MRPVWHDLPDTPDRLNSSDVANSVFEPITGLPDARVYGLLVERKLSLARRALRPLSLIAFAIDGHNQMNESEIRVATLMTARLVCSTLRQSDTVCHLGDGVFVAILDDTSDSGAVWAANRVRTAVAVRRRSIVVTLSMGVAAYPTHAFDAGELSGEAFTALHVARSMGPERIEVAV